MSKLSYPSLSLILLLSFGCALVSQPGSNLNDVPFTIHPYIHFEDNQYFLVYQIDTSATQQPILVRVLYHRIIDGKAYYFFSGQISHIEQGKLIKRPLDFDGFAEYARRDEVYWLNYDRSTIKLAVKTGAN